MKYWRVYWLALGYSLHSRQTSTHEFHFPFLFFYILKTAMTSLLHTTQRKCLKNGTGLHSFTPTQPESGQKRDGGREDSRAEWGADRESLVLQASPWMERSNRCRYMLHLPARQEGTGLTQGLELRSEPRRKQNVFSTECI